MSNPWTDFSAKKEETRKRVVKDRVLIYNLWDYAKYHKRNLMIGIVATLLTSLTGLISPYLHLVAIDNIITPLNLSGFLWWIPIFIVVVLTNYAGQYVQTYQFRIVGENVVAKMRDRIMEKLQVISLHYFSEGEIGRIISRPINDANTVRIFLRIGLTSILVDVSAILGSFAIMFFLNIRLALLSLTIVPVALVSIWYLGKYSRRAYRRTLTSLGGVTGRMQEDLAGIKIIQAYSQEDEAKKQFDEILDKNVKANIRAVFISSSYQPIIMTLRLVGTIIILFFATVFAVSGDITLGTVVAFTEYQFQYFIPLVDIVVMYDQYQSAMAAVERLFDLINTKVEVEEPKPERTVELP
jgi:ABC-type multidrug transport system fused ATPase/permease subunit